MDVLVSLGAIGGLIFAFWLGFRWLRRRYDAVDSYYERQHGNPPAADVSGWPGGRY